MLIWQRLAVKGTAKAWATPFGRCWSHLLEIGRNLRPWDAYADLANQCSRSELMSEPKNKNTGTFDPAGEIQKLLVSADELAKMLDVSERTIWRLLSGGKLPRPLRLGGSVRWRLAEVTTWIAEGCPVPK
jgi:excisionase family DNA binding protein